MTYTSKLKAGDMAWFMKDNKPVEMMIGSVTIKTVVDEGGRVVYENDVAYGFRIYEREGMKWESVGESQVFATKKELLESL